MYKSLTKSRKIAIGFLVLFLIGSSAIAFEHYVLYPPRLALWVEVDAYAEKYRAENPGKLSDAELDALTQELYWEAKEKRGVW